MLKSLKHIIGQGQARLEVKILFWIMHRDYSISHTKPIFFVKNQKKRVKGKKDPLINFL
jgi:hypothetical protein